MTKGGTVPGGMKARERFTWAIVSALAWAMSVPGWKSNFIMDIFPTLNLTESCM